jgi:lipopolysaccharide assembly outer membrane protein LptD (OstA)
LFYWNHSGVIDQVWRLNADYTKVSDPDYFNDFSSKYGSSTDGYATQKFSAGYVNQNFDATVSTKQFQVFNRESSNSYAAQPQLDVNYYQNDVGPFDTHLYGQAVHFVNTNGNMPEATRVHFEPTINLPLSNGWGSINTEAKLLATHYQQSNLDNYNSTNNADLKSLLTASCRSLKSTVKWSSSAICRRGSPKRWSRACSICISRIAIRAKSVPMTPRCCSQTTAACSATVPTAAWTVLLPRTSSLPA